MRKFFVAALALSALALVAWAAAAGVERELQRQHLSRVCEPGANNTGRKAGLHYGAWTHRVPGLGRHSSKEEKIKTCKSYGFNPED